MHQKDKILIVTHQLYYGAAQALRDFLISKKMEEVFFVGLPFFNQRNTFLEQYKRGRKKEITVLKRKFHLGIIDYLFDAFTVIYQVVKRKKKYDFYFGAGTLDCALGIVLKKMGVVKKVIFYSIDFVPIRFSNTFLNAFFHRIEVYCVKNSDSIWNVSPRIAEGRQKFLNLSAKQYPQQVVPIGIWNDKIKKRSLSQIKKNQILFMGHLLEKQGVQMALEALPLVIKKVPNVHFIIAGGGEYMSTLQNQVEQLSLTRHVTFTGWITERPKIEAMISESALAVATYKPEKKQLYNFTYYADPTKLKDYLGGGLPIILTNISHNAQEIAEKKCGILVKYDKQQIAKAIIKLLSHERTLQEYRKNALRYAKEFDWSNIFEKAIY